MKWPFFVFSISLLLAFGPVGAQSPYHFSFGKEMAFIGGGGAALAGGALLKSQTTLFTINELERLDPMQVNAFDRGAIDNSSLQAKEASNYFLYGSHLLPLLFVANRQTRHDLGQILFLYSETALLASGLTLASKYTFRRPRPYVYNTAIDAQEKQKINAKTAFFSGHTSVVAANAFFTAKVFSDYFPESKWKPVVWATAAAIPAVTGYLRVKAGRHYPTDVIAGYAAGALVGYFVPHLHKRPGLKNKGVELYGGMNGALLRVVF